MSIQIDAIRSAMLDVAERTQFHSENDLRALKNTAEILAYAILLELKERDAQMVDQVLAFPTKDEH